MSMEEVTFVMQERVKKCSVGNESLLGDIEEFEISHDLIVSLNDKSKNDEDYPLKLACAVIAQVSKGDAKQNKNLQKYLALLDNALAFDITNNEIGYTALYFPLIDAVVFLDNKEIFEEILTGKFSNGLENTRDKIVTEWAKAYHENDSILDSCVVRNALDIVKYLKTLNKYKINDRTKRFIKDQCDREVKRVDYSEVKKEIS